MKKTNLTAENAQSAKASGISPEMLQVLRHSIGYDDSGNDRFPNARSLDERRNRFVTGPESSDWASCQQLVRLGLIMDHGAQYMMRGDHYFMVTEAGREVVLANRPVVATKFPGDKTEVDS